MTRPSYEEEREMIRAAAAQLPAEFGLRAFPGKRFRVNVWQSYYHEGRAEILLYLDVRQDGKWLSFDKDSVEAIKRVMVSL
jgi:hypothetical protein